MLEYVLFAGISLTVFICSCVIFVLSPTRKNIQLYLQLLCKLFLFCFSPNVINLSIAYTISNRLMDDWSQLEVDNTASTFVFEINFI